MTALALTYTLSGSIPIFHKLQEKGGFNRFTNFLEIRSLISGGINFFIHCKTSEKTWHNNKQ